MGRNGEGEMGRNGDGEKWRWGEMEKNRGIILRLYDFGMRGGDKRWAGCNPGNR